MRPLPILCAMDILNRPAPRPSPQPKPAASRGWAPLALGFRPFFLLAGLAGAVLMVLWTLVWRGYLVVPAHYDAIAWHGHEMLFGYSTAIIAGFLLTAVRNWTGVATWTGRRLGLLVAVWLLARLMPWLGGVPSWLLGLVDVVFLPLVAVSLYAPLWQGQNRMNRVFVPLLLLMGLANLLSHLQLLGLAAGLGDMRRVMLDLVIGIIVLVAGRVMPFFTRNVLPGFEPGGHRWVERSTLVALMLIVLTDALPMFPAWWSALLWFAFAAVQAIRLSGWFDRRVFTIPVLWVLHVGYLWLVLGALLTALGELGLFPAASALHALTVGAIGVFTVGMMSRVARGHTGRPIDVPGSITVAFVAMNAAALVRVFGTAWLGSAYAVWVDMSAVLWTLGLGMFAWHYLPILLRPRIDGKPG